ncbi:MAG: hypothetical protein HFJ50_00635, partial [Clostridia bacterium]|nr:hypothetical protein [Clostridia bacterium]
DKINPSVSITAGTGTTNTIPVTIKASDANGIKSYKYEYKLQSETTWKTATFSNNSYTGLSDGKTYDLKVTVTDGAGRTNSAQTTGTTKVANTPPYNLTTNCSSKTTTSMTIRARAYDNDSPSQTLTYKLYWGGSNTAMDTKTGTSGNYVTFTTKTGLAEYTTQTYSWRVEVTDSKSNPISANGTDRTSCGGRTLYCSRPTNHRMCGLRTVGGSRMYGWTDLRDCIFNYVVFKKGTSKVQGGYTCKNCGTVKPQSEDYGEISRWSYCVGNNRSVEYDRFYCLECWGNLTASLGSLIGQKAYNISECRTLSAKVNAISRRFSGIQYGDNLNTICRTCSRVRFATG